MEYAETMHIVERLIDDRLSVLMERISVLEIAHEAEHPSTVVEMEADAVPVEALESLPVETPAIVVVENDSEQIGQLTEQVSELSDAVEELTSERVVEDAVENAVEDAVEEAVEDVVEDIDTEAETETVAVETEDDTVLELPVVSEQEIKPERRGFLDRKLFGR